MGIFNRKQKDVGENRFRKPEAPRNQDSGIRTEQRPEGTRSRQKKSSGIHFSFRQLLDGSLFANEKVVKNLPFILFLAGLGILYIGNSSVAERNRRNLARLTEELKELRYQYISTKSGVMYQSNPSQISEKLRETGIRESTIPPVKIFSKKDENQK
ncbi:MAG TPA: FtsL-like putative cell division protein [Bacteroidales bacterium]|nr:FtsL-like putative cell division protein [Bacteroidales bacterium]HRZ48274.1 FtsL-like putative cell division protein [Bacteroidales bacterium]